MLSDSTTLFRRKMRDVLPTFLSPNIPMLSPLFMESSMYIDLPENAVRYCFRTLDDASAFKRRFGDASQGRTLASGH